MSVSNIAEGNNPNQITQEVKNHTLVIRAALDMEREMELVGGEINTFRRENLFYLTAKTLQETEDDIFRTLHNNANTSIESKLGNVDVRWHSTIEIARQMRSTLKAAHANPAIIDSRAKSNFSIWSKMQRFDIDTDEIFDTKGIRIVTWDETDAYEVQHILLENYQLMSPHDFRRLPKKHEPIRDRLTSPFASGYAAIHMNFVHETGIFETQITTRQAFIDMHQQPAIPAATILAYK